MDTSATAMRDQDGGASPEKDGVVVAGKDAVVELLLSPNPVVWPVSCGPAGPTGSAFRVCDGVHSSKAPHDPNS